MPGSAGQPLRQLHHLGRHVRARVVGRAAAALLPALPLVLSACAPADEREAEGAACAIEPVEDAAPSGMRGLPEGLVVHLVPWADAFTHDAAVGPDGTVWFSDMWNGCVGRLDPATGRMEAVPLPTPGSNPHGLAVDPEGEVWYAAQAIGRIGRVDPAAGTVREYALGSEPIDPHTVLPHGGRIWFTASQSSRYGLLDPESGVVRIHDVPPPGAGPYDLAAAPDGSLWVTLNDGLGRIDPATGQMELVALPHSEARPSGVAADEEGRIWYLDRERSRLGVLDPRSGAHREFATAGADASPRALAIGPDGRLWYFEERSRRLVAFRPPAGRHTAVELPELPTPGVVVRRIAVDGARGWAWAALGEGAGVAGVDLEGEREGR